MSHKNVISEEEAVALVEEYSYFNNMPIEGWAWEFIRRNPNYIALYDKIEEDFKSIDIVQGDTDLEDIHTNILDSPIRKKISKMYEKFGIVITLYPGKPHDAGNFMNMDKLPFLIEIPNPKIKYIQFCRSFPNIKGTACVNCFVIDEKIRKAFRLGMQKPFDAQFKHYCHELITKDLPPVDIPDTLYLGVSMSGTKSEIMKQIETILDQTLTATEGKKVRKRDNKWNYYLVTYDLFTMGKPYSYIADILMTAYDVKDKGLFDERNIGNYYKEALFLINGGYKKYLSLTK